MLLLLAALDVAAGTARPVRAADGPASTILHPGDDVGAIVAAAPEGGVFVFAPGLYRGVSVTPKTGDRFIGLQHGAILSGARVLSGFTADGARWSAPFAEGPPEPAARCQPDRACDRPEALFIDGVAQRRVTRAAAVAPGTFFVDETAGRLIVGSDPQGKSVEVSAVAYAFAGTAAYVRIGGLVVEKYAAPADAGAIGGGGGKHWTIEDCEIRFNDGAGIRLGDFSRAIHNVIHDNGRVGITGGGAYVAVERNEIAANNTAGFDPDGAAGGARLTLALHAVFRENDVHDNHGPGLSAEGKATLYEGNRVEANDGPGIRDVLSVGATVRENVLTGNGKAASGDEARAQLLLADSAEVDVYANRVIVPEGGDGIVIAEGAHASPAARDDFVHDNDIAMAGGDGLAAGLLASGADEAAALNDHLDRNRYHAPALGGRYWRWPGTGAALTFDELRGTAHEEHDGTIDYVPAPEAPPAK